MDNFHGLKVKTAKDGSFIGTGFIKGSKNENSLDNPGGGGEYTVVVCGKPVDYFTDKLGAWKYNLRKRCANTIKEKRESAARDNLVYG